jgi:hypothetical protein
MLWRVHRNDAAIFGRLAYVLDALGRGDDRDRGSMLSIVSGSGAPNGPSQVLEQAPREMNAADRAHLLRARFRALGGLPYYRDLKTVKPAKPAGVARKPSPLAPLPFSIYPKEHQIAWVYQPDTPSTKLTPSSKRRKGESPLTRIAAQLPRKFIRIAFVENSGHVRCTLPMRP